jgi:hypothetical protein
MVFVSVILHKLFQFSCFNNISAKQIFLAWPYTHNSCTSPGWTKHFPASGSKGATFGPRRGCGAQARRWAHFRQFKVFRFFIFVVQWTNPFALCSHHNFIRPLNHHHHALSLPDMDNVLRACKIKQRPPQNQASRQSSYTQPNKKNKNKTKLDPWGKTAPGIVLKKKTFSYRSRKSPNPYPTCIQWHHNSRETELVLDPCFGVEQTRGFFFNAQINYTSSGQQICPRVRTLAGRTQSQPDKRSLS